MLLMCYMLLIYRMKANEANANMLKQTNLLICRAFLTCYMKANKENVTDLAVCY